MRTLVLLSTLSVLPGCYPCDFEVNGACIFYRSDDGARAVQTYDEAAWREAIEASAAYWKLSPMALDGWTIVIHSTETVRCYGVSGKWGCAHNETSEIHLSIHYRCEAAVFAHEVGHVRFPDPFHDEAEWQPEADEDASWWRLFKIGCPYWPNQPPGIHQ